MILVLIPSRHEAVDLLALLEEKHLLPAAEGARLVTGKLDGRVIAVAEIGMGAFVSGRRTAAAISALGPAKPEAVWLAGYGGGLDPALRRGDIAVLEREPGALPQAEKLPAHTRIRNLHTASEIVATPADKARLFTETGASVVEMEADAVFRETDRSALPSASIRVISDAHDESLPADLLACGYDAEAGRETPWRMALRLASHPRDIARLRAFLAPLPAVRRNLTVFIRAAVGSR